MQIVKLFCHLTIKCLMVLAGWGDVWEVWLSWWAEQQPWPSPPASRAAATGRRWGWGRSCRATGCSSRTSPLRSSSGGSRSHREELLLWWSSPWPAPQSLTLKQDVITISSEGLDTFFYFILMSLCCVTDRFDLITRGIKTLGFITIRSTLASLVMDHGSWLGRAKTKARKVLVRSVRVVASIPMI